MTEEKEQGQKSNVVQIARFFDMKAADAMAEFKMLSVEEKEQLGEGIRNGTLNY